MGYCYEAKTGALCCDVCDHAGGVRKFPCPFNYCQAIALCPACHTAHPEYTSKAHHRERGCERYSREFHQLEAKRQELIRQGHFVRCSALIHPEMTVAENIKVIFQGKDVEQAYFMSESTYHAIPLLVPATVEDYQQHGRVIPAQSVDIYQPV